jgi:predicted amidohydrolase
MGTKISVGQFNITLADYESNFRKAESLISLAASQQCELILLPELWVGGYDYEHMDAHISQSIEHFSLIRKLASSLRIAIAGTYPVKANDRLYNSMLYIDPTGNVYDYKKIHLFSLMREDQFFTPGDGLSSFTQPWGKFGMAICYDLRFPEVFRKYALNDVNMVLISAEWPIKRIDHWKTLLKSRAIENQIFIIACNAFGSTGNEIMGGSSAIIDPWGSILAEASTDREELITAVIDLDLVGIVRDAIPVYEDRRPDIYG